MKKKISLFVLMAIVFSILAGCGSSEDTPDNTEPEESEEPIEYVDSAEDIESQLGIKMSLPASAKNASYSIVSGDIGQIEFDYRIASGFMRASTGYSREDLYKADVAVSNGPTEMKVGRKACQIYVYVDGTSTIHWKIDDCEYVVYLNKALTGIGLMLLVNELFE